MMNLDDGNQLQTFWKIKDECEKQVAAGKFNQGGLQFDEMENTTKNLCAMMILD